MKLPEEEKSKLLSCGLDVKKVPFQDGYRVFKPNSVEGNFVEGYEQNYVDGVNGTLDVTMVLNSPISNIFEKSGKYSFLVWEFAPGPGPGDFENCFDDISDCIEDVIDYYFGDSSRMNEKKAVVELNKRL